MNQTYDKLQRRREIGENIRRARLAKNITQEELAQLISQLQNSTNGGNPQTIYRIENAITDFGIDTFLAIAEVLELPPNSLFRVSNEEREQRLLEELIKREQQNRKSLQNIVAILTRMERGTNDRRGVGE